jgi:DEAD/DEAH box helicase domain-containing protein
MIIGALILSGNIESGQKKGKGVEKKKKKGQKRKVPVDAPLLGTVREWDEEEAEEEERGSSSSTAARRGVGQPATLRVTASLTAVRSIAGRLRERQGADASVDDSLDLLVSLSRSAVRDGLPGCDTVTLTTSATDAVVTLTLPTAWVQRSGNRVQNAPDVLDRVRRRLTQLQEAREDTLFAQQAGDDDDDFDLADLSSLPVIPLLPPSSASAAATPRAADAAPARPDVRNMTVGNAMAHMEAHFPDGTLSCQTVLPAVQATTMHVTDQTCNELGLHEAVAGVLPPSLYSHQFEALSAVASGRDVAIATGTGSGKSLCYLLPLLSRFATSGRTALLLFPTKALARDQLGSLVRAMATVVDAHPDLAGADPSLLVQAYDGDCSKEERVRVEEEACVVLTNVDTLHATLLRSGRFDAFLGELGTVVVDEAHAYRGIFASRVAVLLRRLRRKCSRDDPPSFIVTSATMANPASHATSLTGTTNLAVVSRDGGPRGKRTIASFVRWEVDPEATRDGDGGGDGEPVLVPANNEYADARDLLVQLVLGGLKTLCFTFSRVATEMLLTMLRQELASVAPELVDRVTSYRGGHRQSDRRATEAALLSGDLLCVVCTNALELGIDIGSLEATVTIGVPLGGAASLLQQMGRAGRRGAAVGFFLPKRDPFNMYYAANLRELLQLGAAEGLAHCVELNNAVVLREQLPLAAFEVPLVGNVFGCDDGTYDEVVAELVEAGRLTATGDGRHTATRRLPRSLRSQDEAQFIVYDGTKVVRVDGEAADMARGTDAVIESLGEWDSQMRYHPGAVVSQQGTRWQVEERDDTAHAVRLLPTVVNYRTKPHDHTLATPSRVLDGRDLGSLALHHVRATVARSVPYFKKVRGNTIVERVPLGMPTLRFTTSGVVIAIPPWLVSQVGGHATGHNGKDPRTRGFRNLHRAMHGAEHALRVAANRRINFHPSELCGNLCDASALSEVAPQLVFFDTVAGGTGISRQLYAMFAEVVEDAATVVANCGCISDAGCPHCILHSLCDDHNETSGLDKRLTQVFLQGLRHAVTEVGNGAR